MLEEQVKYLAAARNLDSLFYTCQKREQEHLFVLNKKPDGRWLDKKSVY